MSENATWVENQLGNVSDDQKKFRLNWRLKCKLYGSRVFGWTFISLFAILIPTLVYYLIINLGTYTSLDTFTCLVNETFRVPCGRANITSDECVKVSCCFDRTLKTCYHYLPSRYSYDSHDENREYVVSHEKTPFGTKAIKKMNISVNELNSDQVAITLHDGNSTAKKNIFNGSKSYVFRNVTEKLMVEIIRNDTNDLVLSTAKGPLIASENYWEWTLFLSNHSIFGLNQTLITLNHDTNFSTVLYKNKNDHHSSPTFWAYSNGKFHGVVIDHAGPLEIKILPSNLIILRSLTGGNIELKLSLGPTPKQLHDQQAGNLEVPPFWMLGVHICRKTNELNATKLIEQFSLEDEAETYCIDDNFLMALMNDGLKNQDKLNETLTQLNSEGKKFLLSVPPQVLNKSELRETAARSNVLYQYNGSDYIGRYLKQRVVYPDYSNANISTYLVELRSFISKYITVDIDGFMLSDNWPKDDSFRMWKHVDFPYFPEIFREAMSYTIPWNATIGEVLHIENHNSYGPSQLKAFEEYYKNTSILISSATKTNVQTQPTFIENIESSWDSLQQYLDNLLFDSISGNHLVSLPVCGDTSEFNSTLQEKLCIRWYIVAATMPLFRITSLKPWREPTTLDTKFAALVAKEAIRRRKMFLPYYYTILKRNEPVIRPMFYDYYENTTTFSMKNQYMIGDRILVSHPLTVNRQKLQVYLPSRVGVWYELWGGDKYTTNRTHSWVDLDLIETDFVAFIAQGSIIPLVDNHTIDVTIGLNCTNTPSPCQADGTLLLDNNNMKFYANDTAITISNVTVENCSYILGYIYLYYYDLGTNYKSTYLKNKGLCDEPSTIIFYE